MPQSHRSTSATPPSPHRPDRRGFLQSGLAVAGATWAASGAYGWQPGEADTGLIIHSGEPMNAEPQLRELVKSWVTPISQFYIRSHAPVPRVDLNTYRLSIEGMVDRPLQLSLQQLKTRFGSHSIFATMTCAGNRRSEHSAVKEVSGVQWQSGAIGNANWGGPRLSDVLKAAGVQAGAKHVWFEGLDEVQRDEGVIPFGASVPIEKVMNDSATAPGVLLAHEMNNAQLSPDHGYPLRTVVPGYIGARSVKWLGKVIVSDQPSDNYYLAKAYKLVTESTTKEQAAAAAPLYEYVMNAVTCAPEPGAATAPGAVEVRGYALPPGRPGAMLRQVEVSADNGTTWTQASLHSPRQLYCWQLWSARVRVTPQTTHLLVRATDSDGNAQPQQVDWNLKGYMFNAWHKTPIQVNG
ncbi:MAG: molybdopterin-dependent oxidoreductase [Planctomycetales bacterium]|nr:molybdopterin-dependent oxidoreductase [Planctomycetales bacterium]